MAPLRSLLHVRPRSDRRERRDPAGAPRTAQPAWISGENRTCVVAHLGPGPVCRPAPDRPAQCAEGSGGRGWQQPVAQDRTSRARGGLPTSREPYPTGCAAVTRNTGSTDSRSRQGIEDLAGRTAHPANIGDTEGEPAGRSAPSSASRWAARRLVLLLQCLYRWTKARHNAGWTRLGWASSGHWAGLLSDYAAVWSPSGSPITGRPSNASAWPDVTATCAGLPRCMACSRSSRRRIGRCVAMSSPREMRVVRSPG